MVLREIALPSRYSVYAICDIPSERCQVEEFMLEHQRVYERAIGDLSAMMRDWVPQFGPPFESEDRARRLHSEICEFKAKQKRRRNAPRVLFFEDGRIVICTNAFMKPPGSTPESEIEKAILLRSAYLLDRAGLRLRVLKGWGVP
jgi:hypothetical protein